MSKKIMNKKIADRLRETNEQRWERIKKAAEATDENPYTMLLEELQADPKQFQKAKEQGMPVQHAQQLRVNVALLLSVLDRTALPVARAELIRALMADIRVNLDDLASGKYP